MAGPHSSTSTPIAPASDAELVAAAQEGQDDAVLDLYHRLAPAIRVTIRDRVSSADLVDELVQETFTRVLERLSTLRNPERVRSWTLAIARNVANDRWRLDRRQLGVDAEVLDTEVATGPAPEELASLAEQAALVSACMLELPVRDATALALVTYLDLAPAEVGLALGLKPNAAKVVVHRARRRLRTALALEVLRRDPGAACAAIPPLDDAADRRRHVDDCEQCVTAARHVLAGLSPGGDLTGP